VGDDEIAAGAYSLKDMQSGEQQRVSRDELLLFAHNRPFGLCASREDRKKS
jgi:histidyl-tRNA synthetase